MNKLLMVVGLVGVAGVGYLIYKKLSPVAQAQAIASANSAMPSLAYPYNPNSGQAARMDNKAQPWYGGAQPFNQKSFLGINVGDVGAAADITSSASSIWNDLDVSNWFSGGADSNSLDSFASNDTSDNGGYDWSSMDFSSVV